MWPSPKSCELSVLILDTKLVVFVNKSSAGTNESLCQRPLSLTNLIRLIPKPVTSPFRSAAQQSEQSGSVLAYEIKWENVVGFDFRNELCYDGRLALELKQLHNYRFPSLLVAFR
jgi:hypothetical protein